MRRLPATPCAGCSRITCIESKRWCSPPRVLSPSASSACGRPCSTRLLMGAVTNPHSRHPVATAAAFASLAELAPGRVVAGFGAGGTRVFDPLGLHPARPFTALRECVDVVDSLLRGHAVSHRGEFFTQ